MAATPSSSRNPSRSSSVSSNQPRRRVRVSQRYAVVSRPPLLLEFTDSTCRVGYAGDAQPARHIILPVGVTDIRKASYSETARLVQTVFLQLGQDPTERNVVVLTTGLYNNVDTPILQKALWNAGVPACKFLPNLLHLATALPVQSGLLVLVDSHETHCVAFACDTVLPFTYQVVPTAAWDESNNIDTNMDAVVTALLQCLQECPRDVRKQVVASLFFSGPLCTQQPHLGPRVARRLRQVLQKAPAKSSIDTPTTDNETPVASISTAKATHGAVLTTVPIAINHLHSLAAIVGVIQTPYRADLMPWVGASLWVSHWHGRVGEDYGTAVLEWTKRPE